MQYEATRQAVLRDHGIGFLTELLTNSSAIAERPRCMVGQFWPKVEDDILQTI